MIRPAFFAVVLAGISSITGCKSGPPPKAALPLVIVSPVERRDVPVVLRATGTVEPIQTVAVQAQVDGMLERVDFREGDEVRAGQVLFRIDPRPYASQLAQAEAALSRDLAQAQIAERDRARFEELAQREFVTAQQLDQARTNAAAMMATLRSDSAAVDRARLDLDRATVRAPIGGRAGGVLVRSGNLVRAGSGEPLVVINQLSPILVRFAVPATELPLIRQAGTALPVKASPVGDAGPPQVGRLVFVDNAVDSLTGTIMLKASFANPERALWPGGLVRTELEVSLERDAMVVPVSAVITGQQGSAVFVINDSARAELRQVAVRRTTDSLAVLASGVAPGERVVTDGQVRITDGDEVQVMSAEAREGGTR